MRNHETLRIFGTKGFVESTDGGTRTRLVTLAGAVEPLNTSAADTDYFSFVTAHLAAGAAMPLSLEAELHPLRMLLRAKQNIRSDPRAAAQRGNLAARHAATSPAAGRDAGFHRGRQPIYLVIANGSWSRAVPCHVHLRNFRATQATGIVLASSHLDAKPLLERKQDAVSNFAVLLAAEDATGVIPPHAVVFVTLTR